MTTPFANPLVKGEEGVDIPISEDVPDVETTNWNAVKILASKYGIHLRSYEEEKAERQETHWDGFSPGNSLFPPSAAGQGQEGDQIDLGPGTPFRITARPVEGGRIVYRFTSRERPVAAHESNEASLRPAGMTPSSSAGSLFPSDETSANSPLGTKGAPEAKRGGLMTLAASRSIPALRNRPSNGFLRAVGQSVLSSPINPRVAPTIPSSQSYPDDLQAATPLVSPPSAGMNGKLQGGDVLSAILGLHEDFTKTQLPSQGTNQAGQHHSYMPNLRAFGALTAVRPSEMRASAGKAGESTTLTSPHKWTHSPIPQVQDLGEPLFEDLGAFTVNESREKLSDAPATPSDRQVREMQSFESTLSGGTVRGKEPSPSSSALRDPHKTHVQAFEAFQTYGARGEHRRRLSDASQTSSFGGSEPRSADPRSRSIEESNSQSSIEVGGLGSSTAQELPTSAAPGDDPRFILWAAESKATQQKSGKTEAVLLLCQRDGRFDGEEATALMKPELTNQVSPIASSSQPLESPASSASKRRASRPLLQPPITTPTTPKTPVANVSIRGPQREGDAKPKLIAATRARLVAELTSEIDNRLFSDFFYTFRAFMTPQQLLDLIIARFDWAIQEPQGPADEARRRIVRVRTYVVLKTWLLNFFEIDFLRDRALREKLTAWLNDLGGDPRWSARRADMNIITSLKKHVRDLKHAYAEIGLSGLLKGEAGRMPSSKPHHHAPASREGSAPPASSQDQSRGEANADNASSTNEASSQSDVSIQQESSPSLWPHRPEEGLVIPNSTESSNTFGPSSSTSLPFESSSQPHVPTNHRAISRAFVNTVGRLSRFKKTLGASTGSRSASGQAGNGAHGGADSAAMKGLDAFEFEANESGDLLYIRDGVEHFMHYFGLSADPTSKDEPLADPSLRNTDTAFNSDIEEEDEGHRSQTSDERNETPSLDASSALSRSTPASSLDLPREGEDQREGAERRAWSGDENERPWTSSSASFGKNELPALGLGILETDASLGAMLRSADAALESPSSPGQEVLLDPPSNESWTHVGARDHVGPAPHSTVHHAVSDATLRSVDSDATASGSKRRASRSSMASTQLRKSSSSQRIVGHRRRSTQSYRSTAGPKIVSIDDIDLSSDEDDNVVRRALRRLPGARDLRMANNLNDIRPATRQSLESFISLGRVYSTKRRSSVTGSIVSEARFAEVPSLAMDRSGSSTSSHRAMHAPARQGVFDMDLFDPDDALAGYELVKGFRVEDFGSDDEEPGDVEEALRRLQGFIDEDEKAARAKRVEALWEQSRARRDQEQATEEEGSQHSIEPVSRTTVTKDLSGAIRPSEPAGDEGKPAASPSDEEIAPPLPSKNEPPQDSESQFPRARRGPAPQKELVPGSRHRRAVTSGYELARAQRSRESAGIDHAFAGSNGDNGPSAGPPSTWASVLLARQQAQQPRIGAMHYQKRSVTGGPNVTIPTSLGPPPLTHRCFLLNYKSDIIAQQLWLIEAELFTSIDWTELASDRWRERRHKSEVLDWETFYQERVRARAVAKSQGQGYDESAVEAIVARFNLTCNWIASEIVLTRNLDERVALLSKLIRIAWKCYQQSNFASLVQICLGLQSPWVERLRKTWSRVGLWELRILRDLKTFTSPARNFRHLRNAMREMISESGLEDLVISSSGLPGQSGQGSLRGGSSGTASSSGGSAGGQWSSPMSGNGGIGGGNSVGRNGKKMVRGCVPFFGLFISDLAVNDCLPTFIDPTSPNRGAQLNGSGNGLRRVHDAKAFEGLTALPLGLKLESMVNVFKYRNLATTIKTVIALQGQTVQSHAKADGEVYIKCLKVRCLEGHQMTQISNITEP